MALLAEQLIDEWLNRQGFFTMRGVKSGGVDEIDLIGVKKGDDGMEGWHVEAQISFRPVGYLTKLTKEIARSTGKARTSAVKRTPEQLRACVSEFVHGKFDSNKKVRAREMNWPGLAWKRILVHGVVRDPEELNLIASHDVRLVPFYRVLASLADPSQMTGAAGTDISEIIQHFANHPRG